MIDPAEACERETSYPAFKSPELHDEDVNRGEGRGGGDLRNGRDWRSGTVEEATNPTRGEVEWRFEFLRFKSQQALPRHLRGRTYRLSDGEHSLDPRTRPITLRRTSDML